MPAQEPGAKLAARCRYSRTPTDRFTTAAAVTASWLQQQRPHVRKASHFAVYNNLADCRAGGLPGGVPRSVHG